MSIDNRAPEDRRTTPRYSVDLSCQVWGELEGEKKLDPAEDRVEIICGQVRDVSWGGLFVCTPADQPIGCTMTLLVTMPQHRDPVPLRGRVAWKSASGPKGPGLGIKLHTYL